MFLELEGFISFHITGAKTINLVGTFEIILLWQELVTRIKIHLHLRNFRYGWSYNYPSCLFEIFICIFCSLILFRVSLSYALWTTSRGERRPKNKRNLKWVYFEEGILSSGWITTEEVCLIHCTCLMTLYGVMHIHYILRLSTLIFFACI